MNGSSDHVKQHNARQEKWRELLQSNSLGDDPKLLKKRLRKGIPEGMRIIVWPKLAQLDKYMMSKGFRYEELLKRSSPCQREIGLDIDRTFAQQRAAVMRNSLRNVLHALSLAHPSIGYCQGMNTLVMRLLQTLGDETTFWTVSYFISTYKLLEMNLKNPRSTELQNYILERLVEKHLPKVHTVIKSQDILYMSFAPRWFLTLLTASLPRQTLLRVHDCFLHEGYKIIFRAALAMIKIKQRQILQNNYETNQRYLSGAQEIYDKMHPDDFIDVMFGFSLSRKDLEAAELEFMTKNPDFLTKLHQQHLEVEQRRIEDMKIKEQERIGKEKRESAQKMKVEPLHNGRPNPPERHVYGSQSKQGEPSLNGFQHSSPTSFPRPMNVPIPALNPYLHIPNPIQVPIRPPMPQNIYNPPASGTLKQSTPSYSTGSSVNVHNGLYRESHVFEPAPNLPPSTGFNYTNIQTIFRQSTQCDEQIIEQFQPGSRPQYSGRVLPGYDYYRR